MKIGFPVAVVFLNDFIKQWRKYFVRLSVSCYYPGCALPWHSGVVHSHLNGLVEGEAVSGGLVPGRFKSGEKTYVHAILVYFVQFCELKVNPGYFFKACFFIRDKSVGISGTINIRINLCLCQSSFSLGDAIQWFR